ncbi:hypothetical protein [Sulfurisoma sediminicola]|uniref:hypothetical protein n=1 Tax=Sulfurisoma sediminicola TaxID=1381557 RepID=UPI001405115A|nr:hypothetical protein [Sulfurisoma sediminicola]
MSTPHQLQRRIGLGDEICSSGLETDGRLLLVEWESAQTLQGLAAVAGLLDLAIQVRDFENFALEPTLDRLVVHQQNSIGLHPSDASGRCSAERYLP